jgi:3-hydroxy-3-methylglutaryl CoA synthase
MAEPARIVALGAYVPRLRLPRARIAESVGWLAPPLKAPPAGTRAVCNWDEDAVTLAVEAARVALRAAPQTVPRAVALASTTLPFADRDDAALVAGALDLPETLETLDFGSSLRAGTTALANAARRRDAISLVIAADARAAKPGSVQEMSFGHGAAACLIAPEADEPLATILATHHIAADFTDHYRMAGEPFDYALEERWVRDEGWFELVPRAIHAALDAAAFDPRRIDHFVMTGGDSAAKRVAQLAGLAKAGPADSLHGSCGDTGAAHPLLMLAAALEQAKPGEHLLLVGFGQGVDVLLVRAEAALARRAQRPVQETLARGVEERSYVRYLSHAGLLEVDFGMRAERDNRTAHSVAWRKRREVTGFVGGRCSACGTVQYPKARTCVNPACRATDTQIEHRLAEATGRVKSFTEDWQAYSPRPPCIYGNVQFEGGGNLLMEMTDLEAGEIAVGAPVRFVFRIKDNDRLRRFRRYFWKAVKV